MEQLFRIRLDEILLNEGPHMFWFSPGKIPGTDISFNRGFDFRLERWARQDYHRVHYALSHGGIVGETKKGAFVLFAYTRDDNIMMEVTPGEASKHPRLPDGWEDNLSVDNFGE